MSCYPTCGAILGAAEVVPRAAALAVCGGPGAAAGAKHARGGGCGCGTVVGPRGGGGIFSCSGNVTVTGRGRRPAAATPAFLSSSGCGPMTGGGVGTAAAAFEGDRATTSISAAFAASPRSKRHQRRSTNGTVTVGAISDAIRSGQSSSSSNFKSLGDAVNEVNGVNLEVEGQHPLLEDDEQPQAAAEEEEEEEEEPQEEGEEEEILEPGFIIKQKMHPLGCTCGACVTLRDLVNAAPDPTGLADGAVPEDPVLMSKDGGFVVGKSAQKHHVFGCRCPNCNHMRFKKQSGVAKCVTLDDDTLYTIVGKDMCYQQLLNDETEVKRRERIGKANKGKTPWNRGRKHSPETIAKIRANTARAMRDPKTKERMREAAAKNRHSFTTRMKIRRTVRDKSYVKMNARLMAESKEKGMRRGKVGVCSIGTYARRVSAVQSVSFGVWTSKAMEDEVTRLKQEAKEAKRRAREEKRREAAEAKRKAKEEEKACKSGAASPLKGSKKSPEHRAAISAAIKAKWADPNYVKKQKKSHRERKSAGAGGSSPEARKSISPKAQKRAKLVQEMKDIYTKATAAVIALEKRKKAGLDIDEAMLKKALVAVEETRKVLKSVEASREQELAAAAKEEKDSMREANERRGPRVVHVVDGKTVGVAADVDPNGINIE